jgi:hypothetical protein
LPRGLGRGALIDDVADFRCRDVSEVRAKASQLGLLRRGGHGDAGLIRTLPIPTCANLLVPREGRTIEPGAEARSLVVAGLPGAGGAVWALAER